MRKAAVALGLLLGSLLLLLGTGATSAWAQEDEGVQGRLRHEGEPVAGVTIDVTAEGGAGVGTAQSDDEGKWLVPVPEPGMYTVTINPDTFPKGVGLRDPDVTSRTVQVFANDTKTVLFQLGEPREVPGFFSRAPQLFFEGISFGLIIALAALGLSLVFGTTGLVNFSHGELVTLGAILAMVGNNLMGMPLILAALLSIGIVGAFGWTQDKGFWGQLRARRVGLVQMLVISIGLSIFLRFLYLIFIDGETRFFRDFAAQGGVEIGPIVTTPKSLYAMAIAIVIIVAVGFALLKTRLGKATRAVSDNPALAASSGINTDGVIRLVWTVGAALAALSGVMLGLTLGFSWQSGFQILLLIFAGTILGGLGTAFGALVGSLIVGLFIQLSTLWVPPELKNVGALVILILVLLFRPQGVLGRRERVG